MRSKIGLAYLILIALATGSCATNRNMSGSKTVVTPLSVQKVISDGSLVYGLPLTVIDIEIEAERIIEKPGPYNRFAGDLLGLTDVIKTENEFWTITGIVINSHQELDPAEFYVIGTSSVFQTNVLELKKAGLIMDLNPEIYNTSTGNNRSNEADLSRLNIYDLGSDEYFQDKRDTLYKVVSIDTAFVRIPYLVEKKQKLSTDQLAEKAAIRLMELRDGKHLILTGETNIFPQNEAAINEINRLEKEYTELFTGKALKEKHIFKYQIIPQKDLIGKQITLCTFSELTGPGATSEKSGSPVMIEFIPEMKTRNLNVISGKTHESSSQKYDKLIYRVPDVVNVKVAIGNDVLNTSRKLIYQLGEIVRLPSNYIIGK
ncbi:MAG: hypothetical protein H6Q23_1013 [Bacteroidetes bacterium]|nr:hypothetical protein [Bacteroidota bacterium]